jgi:uncharacterized metal-binding protein
MSVFLFLIGLAVAVLGHFPVKWFYDWVRRKSGLPVREEDDAALAVPHRIIGTFERLFAFALVLAVSEVGQVVTVLIAWMAAKLAANWQRRPTEGKDEEKDRQIRANTFIALMAGVLSLAFGALGGAIARCGF